MGKTFLIRGSIETLELPFIEVTGLKDGNLHNQLGIFIRAFEKTFQPRYPLASPTSWMEALDLLTKAINVFPQKKPFVIFLDELPWLVTAKSGLLQALDHFWNTEWVNQPNIKLIVCGSAASWMIDNIVNARGGLHNRLTMSMLLNPFSIQEIASFLAIRSIRMSHQQMLDLYLVIGGIPFYWQAIEKGLSAHRISINYALGLVDCFTENLIVYIDLFLIILKPILRSFALL